jgi:UDP-N-acetyl-D-glucosamine dehydrogenase
MRVAVVGLGYVGLPLALQFAHSGAKVLGLDIDPQKVKLLNSGKSYIKHIDGSGISELRQKGLFSVSTAFAGIKEVDAVIICVPTPLNKNREPDISYIL